MPFKIAGKLGGTLQIAYLAMINNWSILVIQGRWNEVGGGARVILDLRTQTLRMDNRLLHSLSHQQPFPDRISVPPPLTLSMQIRLVAKPRGY